RKVRCAYHRYYFAGRASGEPRMMKLAATFMLTTLTLVSPAFADAPAKAPILGADVPSPSAFAQSGMKAAIYLVALGLLASQIIKKRQGSKSGHGEEIAIISKKVIGQRQALVITEVDGRRFLLGQTAERIQLLTELANEREFEFELTQALEVEHI